MNWLRNKLLKWLWIDRQTEMMLGLLADQNREIEELQTQLADFKEALKKRAAVPVRAVPRYVDYETAQVEALEDFKEKANGVQS